MSDVVIAMGLVVIVAAIAALAAPWWAALFAGVVLVWVGYTTGVR